jgi:enamine deaminase RidA (YjgF/YER057c/UK114 family)
VRVVMRKSLPPALRCWVLAPVPAARGGAMKPASQPATVMGVASSQPPVAVDEFVEAARAQLASRTSSETPPGAVNEGAAVELAFAVVVGTEPHCASAGTSTAHVSSANSWLRRSSSFAASSCRDHSREQSRMVSVKRLSAEAANSSVWVSTPAAISRGATAAASAQWQLRHVAAPVIDGPVIFVPVCDSAVTQGVREESAKTMEAPPPVPLWLARMVGGHESMVYSLQAASTPSRNAVAAFTDSSLMSGHVGAAAAQARVIASTSATTRWLPALAPLAGLCGIMSAKT